MVKRPAMAFGQKDDLKAYEDFVQGHFTHGDWEPYRATLLASHKAVELQHAVVATVVSQDRRNHLVCVRIAGTEPVWVDGSKLDAYSLQNIKDDQVEN
jgi:hypothetical protein